MAYQQPAPGYQPGPPSYTPYAGQPPQPGYAPHAPPPQQYGYQPAAYGQQQANTNVVVVQQQAQPRVSGSIVTIDSHGSYQNLKSAVDLVVAEGSV